MIWRGIRVVVFAVSRSKTMNGSAKPCSQREHDPQCANNFHAVFLGMAAHDLRQPLQVIQSMYEWLSSRFDGDVERMRLQRGERAVSRLAEQLDRLAAALHLSEQTTTMKPSPVPLAPIFDGVRTENVEPRGGAPEGERNGNYRHRTRTKETIALWTGTKEVAQ
jgi:hypothetical protein